VIEELFDPYSSANWLLLKYDPVEKIVFGYLSLTEMESIKSRLGIGIEPDTYFQQKRLSEVKK
jgi:hypothetical protein